MEKCDVKSSNVDRMIKTETLFCMFAARRSGQHAVIWWLRSQWNEPHARLNNCSIPQDARRGRIDDLPDRSKKLRGFIMNYEDVPPTAIADAGQPLIQGVDADQFRYLLVLRDPFNNLASKCQANPERGLESLQGEAALWKTHAREFLRETTFLSDCVPINYNVWFTDPAYRQALNKQLRLDLPPDSPAALKALQDVPGTGQSQFDGRRFHQAAQSMSVLDRWRQKLHEPIYRQVCSDPELWDYSDRIFGVDPFQELRRQLSGRWHDD